MRVGTRRVGGSGRRVQQVGMGWLPWQQQGRGGAGADH